MLVKKSAAKSLSLDITMSQMNQNIIFHFSMILFNTPLSSMPVSLVFSSPPCFQANL
jgi:hypothetical protein